MNSAMIRWLDSCESTSKHLKEQLHQGFSEPLALASATQTAGTGRLGSTWVSLSGNLHLSVAIPASLLGPDMRPLLPMAAGVVVADWLVETTGSRCCLKWPNDLLIDGRKFGGILCEALYQGSEFLGSVIGIGINLNQSPSLDDSYPTTSIRESLAHRLTPQLAADQIVTKLLSEVATLGRQALSSRWRAYAVGSGHYWQALDGVRWWRNIDIDTSGGLILEPVSNASEILNNAAVQSSLKPVTLVSAQHDYRWSMQTKSPVFVADLGNSCIKCALIAIGSDGRPKVLQDIVVDAQCTSPSWFETSLETSLETFFSSGIKMGAAPLVHCVSVNNDNFSAWSRAIEKIGCAARQIVKEPVRLTRSSYDLEALGADRFSILEAAHFYHDQGVLPWPAMLVSLGTATTIDILDGSGLHLGGFILAGLETSLSAISQRGARLPKNLTPDFRRLQTSWPHNSVDAMTQAPALSTLAFLASERKRLAEICSVDVDSVPVWLTGGFAEFMHRLWDDTSVSHQPHLALKGAIIMALAGR